MTPLDIHWATIICTPAYRDWLQNKYRFSMKRQPVVGNLTWERIRTGVMRVRFGYMR